MTELCKDCGNESTIFAYDLIEGCGFFLCFKCIRSSHYLRCAIIRGNAASIRHLVDLLPDWGSCSTCGWFHSETTPHNSNSLYYQLKFYDACGRWPTWEDAAAHCTDDLKERWRDTMARVRQERSNLEENIYARYSTSIARGFH